MYEILMILVKKMNIKALLNFLLRTPLIALYWINRSTKEIYRATFVSSGLYHGIFDALKKGHSHPKEILADIGGAGDIRDLEAWLDVGVSLGELKRTSKGYALRGALSKELTKESEQSWAAYLEMRIKVMQNYIWNAPGLIKEGKRLSMDDRYADLVAKCSLTIEPIMDEVVDKTIPKTAALSMLEVGCGAGAYMKRACERNKDLTVVGLEFQETVAKLADSNVQTWGLRDRIRVEVGDIRDYTPDKPFDIVTLHNLIYYFTEAERVYLFKRVRDLLKDNGKFAITCLCKDNDASSNVINLWATMTEGCGPAPEEKSLKNQLIEAGFTDVKQSKLIGAFRLFVGGKEA